MRIAKYLLIVIISIAPLFFEAQAMSILKTIVKKGMGAYYSSGSRPNQTAQSWGRARLASAITGGPSARVDMGTLKRGCNRKSKALKLAKDKFEKA